MNHDRMTRVPTHIPGLDTILEGGFLEGGVYIVEGPPGAGKTMLASQFCFGHAAAGGKALYITMLAEEHTRMIGHLRRMAFFNPSLVPNRVSYVSAFKILEAEGLAGVLKTVRHCLADQKTTAIVLDGLTPAEEASPSGKDFKKFIHELQIVTGMTGCTALLLSSTDSAVSPKPERTMVDGILEMHDSMVGQHAVRHLVVHKMRGTAPMRGRHFLLITDAGVEVIPRIELSGRQLAEGELGTPGPGRVSFALPELDNMLKGGLPEHSVTALVGPSGSGKTVLGLQFLSGGLKHGEQGLFFGFFERPAALIEKSRCMQLEFATAVADGRIELHWQRPIEGVIDLLAERLLKAVRSSGAKRLFLDGLQGLQAATPGDPQRLREVLSCLADELESMGVTSMYTSETPDLFGQDLGLPISGMSSVTHNIILLEHREREARMIRRIGIVKLRDSEHDYHLREFTITAEGVRIASTALPKVRRPPTKVSRAPAVAAKGKSKFSTRTPKKRNTRRQP